MKENNFYTLEFLGDHLSFNVKKYLELDTFMFDLKLKPNFKQVISTSLKNTESSAVCVTTEENLYYIIKIDTDKYIALFPKKALKLNDKKYDKTVEKLKSTFTYVIETVLKIQISTCKTITTQSINTSSNITQPTLLFNPISNKLLYKMFNDGLRSRDYIKCSNVLNVIVFANKKSSALHPTSEINKILSEKYMCAAIIIIVSHISISNGLDTNQIYNTCDKFLKKLEDKTQSINEFMDEFLNEIIVTPQQQHKLEIRQFEQIVQTNIFTKLSTDDISQQMNITPNQLRSIVKNNLQTTPIEYINQQKIYTSYSLFRMNSKLKTYEISEMLGFYDSSHFIKEFEKVSGITPHKYRRLVIETYSQLKPKILKKRGRKSKSSLI